MCFSCDSFIPAVMLPVDLDVPVFLMGMVWKATAILLAAFGTAWLLRRASASLRHLVWSAAVICLLLLPLASLSVPGWNVEMGTGSELVSARATRPLNPSGSTAADLPIAPDRHIGRDAVGPAGTGFGAVISLSTGLVSVWALGFLLALLRVSIGVRRVGDMARGAEELKAADWENAAGQLAALLPLQRPVALLRSERVSIPMTAGVRRPVILLPNDAEEWTAERRWVVLAHELLHVQRADYLLWMLARLACAVYWFHPLVWLAAARLRKEAEQACDDGVLRLGAEAPAYAEHLVSLARGWSLARTAELAAMAMAQPSHLESRIRALLDPARDRRQVSSRGRLLIAVAAVLVLAPLAAVRAPAQAAAASLQGTVSDSSGARVPGAHITLQRSEDESKAVAFADDAGEFAFASLPAGEYVVEVRKPGFQIQKESVTLASGARQSVDITARVGGVVEELVIVGKMSARSENPRPSRPPQRIRVGGNVQRSKLITEMRPIYPDELQREGVEGMVVLDAVIRTDGSLGDLRLANNLVAVDERLVNAATEAIRYWRYAPTLLNGEPVEVVTTITVNFRLES